MTFGRAIVTAALAATFPHVDSVGECLGVISIGWIAWSFTTDPLPRAIERGLEAFARRYRK